MFNELPLENEIKAFRVKGQSFVTGLAINMFAAFPRKILSIPITLPSLST